MPLDAEHEIICAIRSGDRKAFSQFYKGYYKRVLVLVLFLVGSEEVAEDITQEAFIRLWEKRTTLNENLSLKGFVRQTAKNLVYDHCRKLKVVQNYEKQLSEEMPSDDVTEKLNYKELEQVIAKALQYLSPEKRTIFRQSRFENKTYIEIALSMQTTPKAIERHMARSLSFIKEYLLKYSREMISLLLYCFILLK